MRYDIDPKTLKKAAPREVIPEVRYRPEVVTNTIMFEGKPTETGCVSLTGVSGKLECYTEYMRQEASHNTVSHPKKIRIVTVISGVLDIDYYSSQKGLLVVEDLLSGSKSLCVGEFVLLNSEQPYRLYTRNIDCLFSVVQESGYEARLLLENNTLRPGVEEPVNTRYKSKAKEQLAMLNPQEQTHPLAGNTRTQNSDNNINPRPLSEAELAGME
jgi:hypothetical protein